MTSTLGLTGVLDSSAVIAYLKGERGASMVRSIIRSTIMSTVNLAEVLQWGIRNGREIENLPERLYRTGLVFVNYTPLHALETGRLYPDTYFLNISLGDRACLGLAKTLGLPAYTADITWDQLQVGTEVRLIRRRTS
jgi:PIN domain nuclease of toxin-antitoxin system